MRAVVISSITFLGVAVGALSAWERGPVLQLAMGCLGAMFAFPIGAGVAALVGFLGKKPLPTDAQGDLDVEQNEGAPQANYWLNRGRLTAAPGLPLADDLDATSGGP
jgi:ABC-type dipeptide/oligopeptide/nickel transport system permease subunit